MSAWMTSAKSGLWKTSTFAIPHIVALGHMEWLLPALALPDLTTAILFCSKVTDTEFTNTKHLYILLPLINGFKPTYLPHSNLHTFHLDWEWGASEEVGSIEHSSPRPSNSFHHYTSQPYIQVLWRHKAIITHTGCLIPDSVAVKVQFPNKEMIH